MYIDKIINKRSPSLILCLAGWSTSPELFRHLEVPEQTDLWIAYDYRTLGFEETFAPYKEVHLVAWSLGVWVATRLWAGHRSFTTATALNGTPFPMHDTLGIPTAIFEGTLHHISEEGMRRFNRRMCGDKETFNRYSELSPRPLEEIKELTGEGLTYPTAGQLREWLSTYFRIVHEEEGNIALTFQHPLEVLRHLKYTGVTANASSVWTRGKQERFCRDYQERFPSADGGVTLTYRPLYILVVKR